VAVAVFGCGAGGTSGGPGTEQCNTCHGSTESAAPPHDLRGATSTSELGVGAHQSHLQAALTAQVGCADCHQVPATEGAKGHADDAYPAEVAFSDLASLGGLNPAWDRGAGTCSNVYCHGASLRGGAAQAPLWTRVDGSQKTCGSCHGFPPPPSHPQMHDCSRCHPTVNGHGSVDPALHIDGELELSYDFLSCSSCHGTNESPAPPPDVNGATSTAVVTVGAHQAHLDAPRTGAYITCDQCHQVPATVAAPGHLDGVTELHFGPLATGNGALAPAWDGASTCSSVYCHGATLDGGTDPRPGWTTGFAPGGVCTSCHGYPPPPPHLQNVECGNCHQVFNAQGTFLPGKHVNGAVDLSGDGETCHSCHGDETSPAPPPDLQGNTDPSAPGVGHHRAHVDAPITRAPVVCSECHPVPAGFDSPGHQDGAVQIAFGPTATKDGTLSPAWDGAEKCNSVYCHGQGVTGGTAKQPGWTQGFPAGNACGFCHGNPPASNHPPMDHPNITQCGWCHAQTVDAAGKIKAGGAHINKQVDGKTCNDCHNGGDL
jgi:predicted CxxxxCH...CXXCH cytochrome family protein